MGDMGQQKVIVIVNGGDGIMRYPSMLCVPDVDGLRERILDEPHDLRYIIHPYSMKVIY